MDALRQEIIAAQNARIDLLKWKLIIVATLAATGLGLSKSDHAALPNVSLVLCCIPIASAYVDLLCQHLTLRMRVIGKYIRMRTIEDGASPSSVDLILYENFVVSDEPTQAFELESFALYYSSLLVSAAVIAYGVFNLQRDFSLGSLSLSFWPYVVSGAIGLGLTYAVNKMYESRAARLDSVVDTISNGIFTRTAHRGVGSKATHGKG